MRHYGSSGHNNKQPSASKLMAQDAAEQMPFITTAKYHHPASDSQASTQWPSCKRVLFSQELKIPSDDLKDLDCLLLATSPTASLSPVAAEEFQIGFRVKATSDLILFPQTLSLHPILSLDVLALPSLETERSSKALLVHILIGSSNGEFALVRFKLFLDSWTFESLTENVI
jgi:hypothetical protein